MQGCRAILLDKDKNPKVKILFSESSITYFSFMKFVKEVDWQTESPSLFGLPVGAVEIGAYCW